MNETTDGSVRGCRYCGAVQASLASELRATYREARKLASGPGAYEDLDWIIGVKRNPKLAPVVLGKRMLDIVELWLEDLAVEVDRRLPARSPDAGDRPSASSEWARREVAARLRAATSAFVAAYRGLESA